MPLQQRGVPGSGFMLSGLPAQCSRSLTDGRVTEPRVLTPLLSEKRPAPHALWQECFRFPGSPVTA